MIHNFLYSTITLMGGEDDMRKRQHASEQIVGEPREDYQMQGEESTVVAVCQHLKVAD